MNLDEWQRHQLGVNPEDITLGLEQVTKVAKSLNILNINTPIITIAGTNGKGSTVEFLNNILTGHGLKTGVYTSPHFINYTERIRINNKQIDEESLCKYFSKIKKNLDNSKITYFEYGILAAMLNFLDNKVDVIILEVGLGGRLDATNAWDCDIAILTSVDLDHEDWLGDTKEKIGFEKSGIFRKNKPAIIGDFDIPQSVLDYAQKIDAQIFKIKINKKSADWKIENTNFNNLKYPKMTGDFQLSNAACAIMTSFNLLNEKLNSTIVNKSLTDTKLFARQQKTKYKNKDVILDVSHNIESITSLKNYLKDTKVTAIFGVMQDKNISKIIKIINPNVEFWHLFPLPVDRAESCQNIKTKLLKYTQRVNIYKNLQSSLQEAIKSDNLIIVFGSFFTVTEFLKLELKIK